MYRYVRDHSSKVELAEAGVLRVHPVGMISSHASVQLYYIVVRLYNMVSLVTMARIAALLLNIY